MLDVDVLPWIGDLLVPGKVAPTHGAAGLSLTHSHGSISLAAASSLNVQPPVVLGGGARQLHPRFISASGRSNAGLDLSTRIRNRRSPRSQPGPWPTI